jgi:hypothetical protein
MDGKTGTGMSIESSTADVVGVHMVIQDLRATIEEQGRG